MSGPFGSSQWMYSSGGFYPTEIEQSLRFNDDDSAYLSWTPASAGNRKTWTWSGWVKRGNLGGNQVLFHAGNGSTDTTWLDIGLNSDQVKLSLYNTALRTSSAVLRDTSAWYHIVVFLDTTAATAADRVKVYVNGVEIVNFDDNNNPSLNDEYAVNTATQHNTGRSRSGAYLDGYMAEINFIDGQALDPTDFGEFKSGVWVAKSYAGSYGTNGFYLNFSDSANIGDDLSGNANDWTANNLVATDVVLDSPTQNWATLNPLAKAANSSTAEGNLYWSSSTTVDGNIAGTIGMSSGKYYFEVLCATDNTGDDVFVVGIGDDQIDLNDYLGNSSGGYSYDGFDGFKGNNGTRSSYGASWDDGDIIGVAFDADSGSLTFYKNGVSQGVAFSSIPSGTYLPFIGDGNNAGVVTYVANFGQDSSFAGNKTAQGNTDANGVGDFYYAPPSGYLALCTANLPDPVIDPAQDDVPSDYFNTVLYTGNADFNSITGVGFQPDLVWVKQRSEARDHILVDAVRTVSQALYSNLTSAEGSTSNFTDFLTDGFRVGYSGVDADKSNKLSQTYVSWNWLAGNGTSSNTDGSITSTVSVNQKAGFSVVGFSDGSGTIGHGLGADPATIIIKNRDGGDNSDPDRWYVWHKSLSNSAQNFLWLNDTSAVRSSSLIWSNTAPTSDVFSFGYSESGSNFIAYCFAEVEGYSKFGSYTGNGSTDGPFVYCGFRPAWVLIKDTDGTNPWIVYDDKRNEFNLTDAFLRPNGSDAEGTSSVTAIDVLSNGFKIRGSSGTINASGRDHIFMAFAENPFKYANAR